MNPFSQPLHCLFFPVEKTGAAAARSLRRSPRRRRACVAPNRLARGIRGSSLPGATLEPNDIHAAPVNGNPPVPPDPTPPDPAAVLWFCENAARLRAYAWKLRKPSLPAEKIGAILRAVRRHLSRASRQAGTGFERAAFELVRWFAGGVSFPRGRWTANRGRPAQFQDGQERRGLLAEWWEEHKEWLADRIEKRFPSLAAHAGDIVQEVWQVIDRKADTLVDPIDGYVWRVAFRQALKLLLQIKSRPHESLDADDAQEPVSPADGPDDALAEEERLKAEARDLDELPALDRELIWQHYCEQVPASAMAIEFCLKRNATAQAIGRALDGFHGLMRTRESMDTRAGRRQLDDARQEMSCSDWAACRLEIIVCLDSRGDPWLDARNEDAKPEALPDEVKATRARARMRLAALVEFAALRRASDGPARIAAACAFLNEKQAKLVLEDTARMDAAKKTSRAGIVEALLGYLKLWKPLIDLRLAAQDSARRGAVDAMLLLIDQPWRDIVRFFCQGGARMTEAAKNRTGSAWGAVSLDLREEQKKPVELAWLAEWRLRADAGEIEAGLAFISEPWRKIARSFCPGGLPFDEACAAEKRTSRKARVFLSGEYRKVKDYARLIAWRRAVLAGSENEARAALAFADKAWRPVLEALWFQGAALEDSLALAPKFPQNAERIPAATHKPPSKKKDVLRLQLKHLFGQQQGLPDPPAGADPV